MRRFLPVLLTAALSALLCVHGLAAESAKLIRTFVYGGTLYTYVELPDTNQPITKAEAKIGTQSFPATGRLETVRQAGFPVTYLLLVDNSNSMPAFQEEVVSFAESLAQSSGENTHFILSTFGDDFSIVSEALSAGELPDEISAIPFDETVTRLHSCIDRALDYFEALPRDGNELRCMLVLSDGVQYDPAGGVSYEELLERISRSDVILHSVGFGDDTAALDRLGGLAEASGGTHQAVSSGAEAAEAAESLFDTCGQLSVTSFSLTGCHTAGEAQTVSVTFASGAELVGRGEAEVDFSALESGEAQPSESPAALPPDTSSTPGQNQSVQPAPGEQQASKSSRGFLFIAAAAGAVLLAAAVAILAGRKKVPAAMPAPSGIYMRLEVSRGELASSQTELTLADELFIGCDSACGIAFHTQAMSRRHARLFTSDGAVYIEDLHSPGGTLVNGLPIDGPSLLRSGDEITVGDAAFRLKF